MSTVNRPDGWGPSHQTEPRRRWIARPAVQIFALGAVILIVSTIHYGAIGIAIALFLVLFSLSVIDQVITARARPASRRRLRSRLARIRCWRSALSRRAPVVVCGSARATMGGGGSRGPSARSCCSALRVLGRRAG
jgi:hypothetical protein